jgi:hypothetical protein
LDEINYNTKYFDLSAFDLSTFPRKIFKILAYSEADLAAAAASYLPSSLLTHLAAAPPFELRF